MSQIERRDKPLRDEVSKHDDSLWLGQDQSFDAFIKQTFNGGVPSNIL
jgi:hypothetical protein